MPQIHTLPPNVAKEWRNIPFYLEKLSCDVIPCSFRFQRRMRRFTLSFFCHVISRNVIVPFSIVIVGFDG